MLSKALLVVKSAALAILGVLVVGGGGTAVAVTATGGQVPVLSALVGHAPHAASKTPEAGTSASSHAHTVSLEGVLKGYDAGATRSACWITVLRPPPRLTSTRARQ